MTKGELKDIIKECLEEVNNESVAEEVETVEEAYTDEDFDAYVEQLLFVEESCNAQYEQYMVVSESVLEAGTIGSLKDMIVSLKVFAKEHGAKIGESEYKKFVHTKYGNKASKLDPEKFGNKAKGDYAAKYAKKAELPKEFMNSTEGQKAKEGVLKQIASKSKGAFKVVKGALVSAEGKPTKLAIAAAAALTAAATAGIAIGVKKHRDKVKAEEAGSEE